MNAVKEKGSHHEEAAARKSTDVLAVPSSIRVAEPDRKKNGRSKRASLMTEWRREPRHAGLALDNTR